MTTLRWPGGLAFCFALCALSACGDETPETTRQPVETAESPETPESPQDPEAILPAPDANEACARAVVVAWQGAPHAADTVTRTKEEAQARAQALLERVRGGEAFPALAREESDAASSGPRGGLLGTFERSEWPSVHDAIAGPLFETRVGFSTDVVEAEYGYVFAYRCPVEKVHTRHILMRFAGARNAGDDIDRTRDEAGEAMSELRVTVVAAGADFEALAREHSEDSSADRGGDLGEVGRGRLAPAYEEAAFALEAGGVSQVIETEFGFHLIQRVE